MNEFMKVIMERRSVRKFKPEQISKEDLDTITLAGAYAPNAGGMQSAIFAVCQNAGLNEELGMINLEILKGVQADLKRSADPKANKLEEPKFKNAFYGAPTVITLFAPKGWYNYTVDCCVAAENMALAAHAVGVGSCMIARATEVFSTARGRELQREWGIDASYEAKLHLLLGYSDGVPVQAKPRKEGQIIIIE